MPDDRPRAILGDMDESSDTQGRHAAPAVEISPLTRETLNDELSRIWRKTGKTILLVTHSVEEAAYLGTRVMVMSPRPGRLRKTFDVDLPSPRGEETKRSPEFLDLVAELRTMMREMTQ